jgi:hypothetical protein
LSFAIVQLTFIAPLPVALEPRAKDVGFKILTAKWPKLTGHFEFDSMNFPIKALSLGENHRSVSRIESRSLQT